MQLTALAHPFAQVSASDRWMPRGFKSLEEAQLHIASALLGAAEADQLREWWLAPASGQARTPNFDIASTCMISGKPGLLLVEAKAHAEELIDARAGKFLDEDASSGSRASHEKIGAAIRDASEAMGSATGVTWHLSHEICYQMSNRFAWAWKLTTLGVPVVLIYLGFVGCAEMIPCTPLKDDTAWRRLVMDHSESLFPPSIWDRTWMISGVPFAPLIRSRMLSIS